MITKTWVTKIYASAFALLLASPYIQAMDAQSQTKSAEKAQIETLLQEFAEQFQHLADTQYPQGGAKSPHFWTLASAYERTVKELAAEYIDKINAIDPHALDIFYKGKPIGNVESIFFQWRRRPTVEARRDDLISYLKKYRDIQKTDKENTKKRLEKTLLSEDLKKPIEEAGVMLFHNSLRNLEKETGLNIKNTNLADMTDSELQRLADSIAV